LSKETKLAEIYTRCNNPFYLKVNSWRDMQEFAYSTNTITVWKYMPWYAFQDHTIHQHICTCDVMGRV